MTEPASDRVFSNDVAQLYDDLMVPLIFEPYAQDMAGRLTGMRGGTLLEVAAGTGVVTRALAKALPADVAITATDLNQAMIDRGVAAGTARAVRWQRADVMSLPYEPASFDVVACQFGVMFFPAKPNAFAEVHRVLRADGQFVFNVWDRIEHNDFSDVVTSAVGALFPADPPLFLRRTPHGYHDPEQIRADLRAGGFTSEVSIEPLEARSRATTARNVALAYCKGTPLRDEIESRGQGRLDDAISVAANALSKRFGPTDLDGAIKALLVTVTT